ncbi:MAG: FAD-dependent oxidoreductase, partial [Clostridia bacterium]|nr:FAD-dependent oxidoreductase [Clostridia bacterium]
MNYDCIVIGGGVIGTAVLDRLAAYEMNVLLLEKEDDVASFTTRANSGIVHAGYDCDPGTAKARFNVRGNELLWQDAGELDVPCLKCGSIVVARADQLDKLKELQKKGESNGVEVRILDRHQTLEIEPNVADEIEYSLYAPSAGIVSPYQLAIAYADRAILNGAKIELCSPVTAISREGGLYTVKTDKTEYTAKIVINCAGANGAQVNDLAGEEHFETTYRRGDYFV